MNSKTTLSVSEARKQIFDIVDAVQAPGTVYMLTEKGRPKAVVMSATEFESWAETLEVMKDFPDLKKDIAEAERDYASGAYTKYTTLNELLARQGLILQEKPATYAVRRSSKAKRGKRTR
ncbi:MAG TPA: type II toxin-antitoxin system Phd/YefM family antitoxin [Patescibacteria group bacterium]|nr:type II toxin-antitoxin system Phd/YefM family antitoxin [Patescibacteria group bacterium]